MPPDSDPEDDWLMAAMIPLWLLVTEVAVGAVVLGALVVWLLVRWS